MRADSWLSRLSIPLPPHARRTLLHYGPKETGFFKKETGVSLLLDPKSPPPTLLDLMREPSELHTIMFEWWTGAWLHRHRGQPGKRCRDNNGNSGVALGPYLCTKPEVGYKHGQRRRGYAPNVLQQQGLVCCASAVPATTGQRSTPLFKGSIDR